MQRRNTRLLTLLLCFFAPCKAAFAEEYRLAPGMAAAPVVAKLAAGDVLVLTAGKYNEPVTLSNVKGSRHAPVTVRGEQGAVIEATGRDGIAVFDCADVHIKGLHIHGARRAGIIVTRSQRIVIRDCRIADCGRWGIQTCLSHYVFVLGCDISGSKKEHGIYFSTTDHPAVRDCRIHDNAGCGVHLNGDVSEGGDGLISGAVIEKNTIYGNGAAGGAAINMDGVEAGVVRENVVYGNTAGGITCFKGDAASAGSGTRIEHNVVQFEEGKGRYAVQLLHGVRDTVVRHNTLICGRGPALEVDEASLPGLKADHNMYYAYGRDNLFAIGADWISLQEWRRRSGQDKKSAVKKPTNLNQ